MSKFHLPTLAILLILLLGWQGFSGATQIVQAADPVVRAVLFYSPGCGHCDMVRTQVLPPLAEQYGERLELLQIDVTLPDGQQLYQAAIQEFKIGEERLGVPTLILGDTVLVGSREIPEQFPGLIESGLTAGGVDWPAVPGLSEVLPAETAVDDNQNQTEVSATVSGQAATDVEIQLTQGEDPGIIATFKQDITANSLAVIVLLGMLLSCGYVTYAFLASTTPLLPRFPDWALPVISILGLGVALYLSYVELFQAEAVCGPVGNCNAVQNSPYAYLFGVIPVGVVGAAGYIAILAGWLLLRKGPENFKRLLVLGIWGIAWIGTFFSIYLTFLEPFVIGATCIWCLTSAVLMTLLLWATTPAALEAMHSDYEEEVEQESIA